MTDRDGIGDIFIDYYKSLFSSSIPNFPEGLNNLITCPFLKSKTLCFVLFLGEEIWDVVFGMKNGKSPGPDGMTPSFFKSYWNIIGTLVVKAVQIFFLHDFLLKELNHTFITLIPKTQGAQKWMSIALFTFAISHIKSSPN